MYETNKAIIAQKEYTDKNNLPHFAPESGLCWNCKRWIYEKRSWKFVNGAKILVDNESPEATYSTGITIEEASTELVTGCPHCNKSYCD